MPSPPWLPDIGTIVRKQYNKAYVVACSVCSVHQDFLQKRVTWPGQEQS